MPGRLFAFEGIDGCGKSTQVRLLELELRRRRLPVTRWREPGGTPIGESIRSLLLSRTHAEMSPWSEVFLFMASRAQLVSQRITPALEASAIVLLDRYYYSTAAYQGAAGSVGTAAVLSLAERTARFPVPDRVFLLDMDPSRAARRRPGAAPDRVEAKGILHQKRVRKAFLDLARSRSRRFRVVRADAHPLEIHQTIVREVDRVL